MMDTDHLITDVGRSVRLAASVLECLARGESASPFAWRTVYNGLFEAIRTSLLFRNGIDIRCVSILFEASLGLS